MRLKCQSRRGVIGAQIVERGTVCELRPSYNISVVGKFGRIPSSKAVRIPVIPSLSSVLIIGESSVKVELLTRVVLMDVDAITSVLITAVLHRVDATCDRMLRDADAISQAPAQPNSLFLIREIVAAGWDVRHILHLLEVSMQFVWSTSGIDEPIARSIFLACEKLIDHKHLCLTNLGTSKSGKVTNKCFNLAAPRGEICCAGVDIFIGTSRNKHHILHE